MEDFGREKDPDWNQLSDTAKIGRLSRVVEEQYYLLRKMAQYLNQLVDHNHLDGKIVRAIDGPTPDTHNDEFSYSSLPLHWLN